MKVNERLGDGQSAHILKKIQHRIWDNHTIVTAMLSSHRDKEENPRYYQATTTRGALLYCAKK